MNLINLMEYHITAEIWRLEMEVMRHILPHRFSIPTFHFLLFFSCKPSFWGEHLIPRPSITCLNEHDCVFLFFYLTVILVGLLWRFSSVERRMRIVTKQKTLHRTSNHRTITLIGCPCVTSVCTRQSNSGSAVMARQPHCSLQCTPSFNIRLQKIQFFFQISKSMIIIIEYK